MNKPKLSHPVFLCGMMGSGKSTIGEKLADKIGVAFADLDSVIEKSEGMSIPEIFEQKQEKGFRAIERNQLIKLAGEIEGILALGGGSLQNQQIVDHLKIYGWLIFIDTSRADIFERLSDPTGRPMLETADELTERINSLFDERMQYYEQAHFSVQTENKSVDEITTEIVKKLTIYEGRDYH
ncbi:shikimate kinase [Rhodohalobacter sulfatireducens]|uniref:Shikimate kinase n=1 Tax=Rhodohalobacter sulfatireducens TaxID=2911366 RepID=A0ABS9KDR8_9BACT|nr:shikimate kinase [Rhodohalobacter sulfatireducens]MCG2589002.1 shikimate kinase [Rhodohalobacter sulfatireducens]MDR9365207.1 shikimate kinase [Balneolaceae bacterium]MDR9408618.1 shikimate kinase [Balneolaceae bacterium]